MAAQKIIIIDGNYQATTDFKKQVHDNTCWENMEQKQVVAVHFPTQFVSSRLKATGILLEGAFIFTASPAAACSHGDVNGRWRAWRFHACILCSWFLPQREVNVPTQSWHPSKVYLYCMAWLCWWGSASVVCDHAVRMCLKIFYGVAP